MVSEARRRLHRNTTQSLTPRKQTAMYDKCRRRMRTTPMRLLRTGTRIKAEYNDKHRGRSSKTPAYNSRCGNATPAGVPEYLVRR